MTSGAVGAMVTNSALRARSRLESLSLGGLGWSVLSVAGAGWAAVAGPGVGALVVGGARGWSCAPCCWAGFAAATNASLYDLRAPHDLQAGLVTQLLVPQEVHL